MMENDNKITITNSVSTKIVWEIDNFSSHANQRGAIKSPIFEIVGPNGDKNKLLMEIYPYGFNGTQEYAALYIKLAEPEKIKVLAKIEFAILDSNREEKHKKSVARMANKKWGWRCSNFIKRHLLLKRKNRLLTNGKLTILCHFDILRAKSLVESIQIPPCQLSADFANLLDGGILADFTTNSIKIKNDLRNVLEKMLHFTYAPNIGAIAKELLAAADKYQMERLKVFCERSLALSLDSGNACEVLVLADHHSAAHLKSEAIQFIKSNAEEVIETDGWKWLAKEHTRLAVPLYEGMIKRKRKSVVSGA